MLSKISEIDELLAEILNNSIIISALCKKAKEKGTMNTVYKDIVECQTHLELAIKEIRSCLTS